MASQVDSLAATPEFENQGSRPQVRSLGRLLNGVDGFVAGLAGAVWIAAITLVERWARIPLLYERGRVALTHLGAEILAGAAVWLVVHALLTGVAGVLDVFEARSRRRFGAGIAIAVLGGVTAGAIACEFVVRPSSVWSNLPALVWWPLAAVSGAAAGVAARALLALRPPRHAAAVGVALLAFVSVPEIWSLERFVRAYGHLLGMVQVGTAAVAALGARLVLLGMSEPKLLRRVTLAIVAFALAALGTSSGSYASRRAVLVYGGVAKHFTLDVLWPLADRDGDGIPASLWGNDPDDRDPKLTPLPGQPWPHSAPPSAPAALPPGGRPRRNLLVVIVDTTRSDSFQKIRAANPAVERAFARFGSFTRYTTCSTRTDQVLVQLLGDARCDARPLPGAAPSLLEALRRAGYHDRAIRYYPVSFAFGRDDVARDDGVVIEHAKRVLAHPPDEPLALFVHLRGGHNVYDAEGGGTQRERYERQLARALARAAELVELAPTERFVVAVLGDHGEAFGEHLSYAHANMLYEEVLSTPLLIASPTVTPGPHAEPLGCSDVAWELLHGLGLAPDLPLRADTQYAAIDLLPGQFGRAQRESMRALKVGDEKVIYTPQSGIWELYDTSADPGEKNSLADRHPERLGPLQHQLLGIASSCPVPPTVGISAAE